MNSPTVRRHLGLALSALLLCLPLPAQAAKEFRGPVEAIVVKVLDGDTFLADALVWPGQTVRVNIRLRGIDAPEMKARCDSERQAALRARQALVDLLGATPVSISNISGANIMDGCWPTLRLRTALASLSDCSTAIWYAPMAVAAAPAGAVDPAWDFSVPFRDRPKLQDRVLPGIVNKS